MGSRRPSPYDDVPSLDPGLQSRMGHGDHILESRADGVRDVGGDIQPHRPQNTVDRCFQAIRPREGDQHDVVSNLLEYLGNIVVSAGRLEAILDVFGDKVEVATPEATEHSDRLSRQAGTSGR
jgi:hypothetical protein